ncbi:HNH endonuclease [Streptomyces sp. NPDC058960]|uniref:HNH endonuclease n=1 Tax=Streptomyces sp. NPDC058960 TaxID=3346679 RepID=UPI0036BC1B8E
MAAKAGKDPAAALSGVKMTARRYLDIVEEAEGAELDQGSWLESAANIGLLSAEMRNALSQVNRAFGIKSGREAILLYLRRHVGEPVPADALAGVSGIAEWARRVRELRVEYGWPVESGLNRDDMPHDHYRLTSDEPDTDLAERWKVAKAARNLKKPDGGTTSGKDRVLHYLQQISPREADKEQLAYVAKIQEWPRRMRELEEEGWQIVSNVDDPTLPPGSYRLPTLEKRPPRVRQAIKLRYEILERDKKTCQDCGRIPGQGVTLQVHHVLPVHQGGTNDPDNLVTLCSECHGGRHALMGTSVRDELLNPDQEPDVHAD